MMYIRMGNLSQVIKICEAYAPRNINFVRGIKEDFEGVDPPISMENFSLCEVAVAYK